MGTNDHGLELTNLYANYLRYFVIVIETDKHLIYRTMVWKDLQNILLGKTGCIICLESSHLSWVTEVLREDKYSPPTYICKKTGGTHTKQQ
jgi:hypothetical protein